MGTNTYANTLHIGRKIGRIRRLRGMTQKDLGDLLGITKQAVSKMEQTEKIDDEKLKQISEALGVTEEGLKRFTEETVLHYTNNSYVTATNIGHVSTAENINSFSIEQIMKLFEELLNIEKEKFNQEKEDTKINEFEKQITERM